MLNDLPQARRRAAMLILRIGELFLALLGIVAAVYLAPHGRDALNIIGLWDGIAAVESAVFVVWLFCFLELELDARIYKHEGELVPTALFWLYIVSFLILFLIGGASALANTAHVHLMDYTILEDGALFLVDGAGVGVTTCLFLARRRLNRAAHAPQD